MAFDLEKAIATWRCPFKHNRAFSSEDIEELEGSLRDRVASLVEEGLSEEAAFREALRRMGSYVTAETEYRKIYWEKLRQQRLLLSELTWRFSMLINYLKIALRTLSKQVGYTLLNVTGLAVGIACCLLIGLYVRHEWSYDRFHEKADRLYRLTYENRIGADLPPATPEEYKAWGSAAIAPLLAADFPEVEQAVRLSGRHKILLSQGEHAFQEEHYFYADSTFFEVFSFPLLEGNPATALVQPNSIVLTETAAQRYFGDQEAFGQTLRLEDEIPLTVTGVMADVPANSHLEFDILLSMSTFENYARANGQAFKFDNWGYIDFFTYVLLHEGTSAEAFQAQLPAFVQRYNGDALQDPPQSYTLALEPITEAYLSPVSSFQPGPKGNEASLYLFVVIAAFILLIACINFMNLSTAHATSRAKEVGVRKTVGARRTGLVGQFLAEAILLAMVATGVAVVLAQLTLPLFRMLADKEVSRELLTSLPVVGVLLLGALLVGVLAGSYPALVISAFRPSQVLKGNFATSSRGVALRKGLVVFQFAAAVVLIVGTLVVRQQLHFLQERPLGFDDAQQLVLDFGRDEAVRSNIEAIKEELGRLPGVQEVAATRSIPGGYYPHATTRVEAPDGTMKEVVPGLYEVDTDFLQQIDLEAAAGRLFSNAFTTDAAEALLLNEAAVHDLGYADAADAVGKRFTQWGR
ncbi:MAG TPA: ABC transporter permease, partial [Rhodothermales bacterium]|nr:ABC transporter permease [Rhodothermales bacterium]